MEFGEITHIKVKIGGLLGTEIIDGKWMNLSQDAAK
jgi:hypothetical protein